MNFDPATISHYSREPGVYIMKNSAGQVLYIGKAKSIRSRLKQYFQKSSDNRVQIPHLIAQVAQIETIITPTEKEALLLESNLIKHHRPKYNILLKDDKTFISILITTEDEWPMAKLVRFKGKQKEKGLCFGPYTNALVARETFDVISRIFPLRECSDREFKSRKRPCLLHSIKRCCAPCVGKCTKPDYQNHVKGLVKFLKGKDTQLIRDLKKQMKEASDLLEYEKAAMIHKTIKQIETLIASSSPIIASPTNDCDSIGYFRLEDTILFVLMNFRGGKLIGSENFEFPNILHETDEVVHSFIMQHYSEPSKIPKEIYIHTSGHDKGCLVDILSERKGEKVHIFTPQKGDKKALVDLAMKNAESLFIQDYHQQKDSSQALLLEMEEKFSLNRCPVRIECFDTSNISGTDPVASMVTYTNGKKDSKRNRLYKIRSGATSDDYTAMKEVLSRRYTRAKEEIDLPDLIIVDGGKGQLNIAMQVLSELDIATCDIISLVKEDSRHDKGLTKERVYIPSKKEPITIDPNSSLMFLLQQIRDEAHRVAITFHRSRRTKRIIKSALDEIPGIGEAKRNQLLQTMGSVQAIKKATLDELMEVKGISRKNAEEIKAHFKKA
ncbi:MAG: UvrABC system protein C [Chlamydiia bacterium]|nr:UvrABC system protein C [Chlamydiia bacterium]